MQRFSAIVVFCLACAFGVIAYLVHSGTTQSFDERLLLACRNPADPKDAIGPKWLEEAGRDMTALGGTAVSLMLSIGVAIWFGMRRQWSGCLQVVLICGVGYLVMELLKLIFHRPRPQVVPHLSHVASTSFPSGHSMMSAVIYLTVLTLAARATANQRIKVFYFVVALLITALVGCSRVYVGVHYPTDVMAGWSAGLAWALGWLAATRKRG